MRPAGRCDFSCGARADQTVACWGSGRWGKTDAPGGAFISVSAGGDFSCGVRVDQTVACWGYGDFKAVP